MLPVLLLLPLPLNRTELLPALLLPGVLALLCGAAPEEDLGFGAVQLPLLMKNGTGWSTPPPPLLALRLVFGDGTPLLSSPCSLSLPLGVLYTPQCWLAYSVLSLGLMPPCAVGCAGLFWALAAGRVWSAAGRGLRSSAADMLQP